MYNDNKDALKRVKQHALQNILVPVSNCHDEL